MTRVSRGRSWIPAAIFAGVFAVALALAPARAHAQAGTFSTATGWMWGVAAFELTLGAGLLIATSGDVCDSWGCGVLALLVGAVAIGTSITAGVLAGANDTPPDIPFAVHNTLWAALTGALGGFAFAKLYAGTDSTAAIAALSSAGVFGLGMGTYSVVRRDELLREPRTAAAAHFLAWGVPGAGLLALLALSSLDIPAEGAAVLYALTTLVAYGVGLAWAETQIARDVPTSVSTIPTPLLTFGGAL